MTRLEELREQLAKAWLVRVVESASLEEIERLPIERIARELPALIAEILRTVAEGELLPEPDRGGRAYRCGARLAALRGKDGADPARVAMDVVTLQAVMVDALGRELAEADNARLLEAVKRLLAGLGVIQAEAVAELAEARSRELESLANTDPLTGLSNVRYMHQELDRLVGLQQRYGHAFAVVMLDVDGLKRINDAFGHSVGDQLLTGVADVLRETIRSIDVASRIGGDEFCVLAPDQGIRGARILAERIAAAVAGLRAPERFPVGASVGVVSCPEHAAQAERLLHLADEAMYRAKASGDRVALGVPDAAARQERDRVPRRD